MRQLIGVTTREIFSDCSHDFLCLNVAWDHANEMIDCSYSPYRYPVTECSTENGLSHHTTSSIST